MERFVRLATLFSSPVIPLNAQSVDSYNLNWNFINFVLQILLLKEQSPNVSGVVSTLPLNGAIIYFRNTSATVVVVINLSKQAKSTVFCTAKQHPHKINEETRTYSVKCLK
jgi:hypothetical protein